MNSDPNYDKTKFYQGYDFMQQTGLRNGYYSELQVKQAMEDKLKKYKARNKGTKQTNINQ
jgi:hypothetical protein